MTSPRLSPALLAGLSGTTRLTTSLPATALAWHRPRPARGRARGAGEDRVLEQIFPAPGEHPAAHHADRQHRGRTAEARYQQRILLLDVGGCGERQVLDPRRLLG